MDFLIPEVISVLDCLFIGSNLVIGGRATERLARLPPLDAQGKPSILQGTAA
jgi:hypothetical protein